MKPEKRSGASKNFAHSTKFIPVLIILFSLVVTTYLSGQQVKPDPPKEKQTTLGLYVTAKEAYIMWKADPARVKILDVRTPEEYLFIGHPAMAWNIPLLFQTFEWNADKKHFPMKSNPEFISMVKQMAGPADTLLVICRSGGRSAIAVSHLAQAGYSYVYSISDGFEGDVITDPESVFTGQRMKNGWKNSGLPWTYTVDPKLMLISGVR